MAIAAMTTIASDNRLGLAPGMRLWNMADTPHYCLVGGQSSRAMFTLNATTLYGTEIQALEALRSFNSGKRPMRAS